MNVTLTLFGQMLTFAVLIWFVMKFLWDPVLKLLEDRKQKIADGLAAAERGMHEKELAENRAKEVLVEAKEQAKEIISLANKRADEIVDEAKVDARAEGGRLITAAKAEIDQQMNSARESLRGEVVAIALAGAEQILKSEVDHRRHNEYLEKLAADL